MAVTGNSNIGNSAGKVTIGVSGSNSWTTADLTIGAGGVVTCTGASKINVGGDWDCSVGVFTAGASNVTFNGGGTSTIDSGGTADS